MWHKSSCFSKSLHILGVTSIDIIYAEAVIILTLWLCEHFWLDYSELRVTTSNTSNGSFSGCLFLDFGQLNWWETHPSRFLPFSPSSMLIDHIIITFLLMVVGCDGWEGCKSISRGLFVANIQPTNRPAARLSNIKWVVRSEVDYHYRDFYHPVKCQNRQGQNFRHHHLYITNLKLSLKILTDYRSRKISPRSTWTKTFLNNVWLRGTWIGEIFRPCF